MEEYFSPDEVRSFIHRSSTDRQRLILFLIFNYGLTVDEILSIKAGQFMPKPDYILLNFTRKLTGKQRTVKIVSENSRLFHNKTAQTLQAHEPLLHKEKNLPITEAVVNKDLFDLAILMNKKITPENIFDSHLFWIFKKGVTFSQAVEEYGLEIDGKPFNIWEDAILSGRCWPTLID